MLKQLSNLFKENKTMVKVKCRTCLQTSDLLQCTSLTHELLLGRCIKEVLLLFVPQMITSTLVEDIMCQKCFEDLQVFGKFIKKFIAVEKYLTRKEIERKGASKASEETLAAQSICNTQKGLHNSKEDKSLDDSGGDAPPKAQCKKPQRNGDQNICLRPKPLKELLGCSSAVKKSNPCNTITSEQSRNYDADELEMKHSDDKDFILISDDGQLQQPIKSPVKVELLSDDIILHETNVPIQNYPEAEELIFNVQDDLTTPAASTDEQESIITLITEIKGTCASCDAPIPLHSLNVPPTVLKCEKCEQTSLDLEQQYLVNGKNCNTDYSRKETRVEELQGGANPQRQSVDQPNFNSTTLVRTYSRKEKSSNQSTSRDPLEISDIEELVDNLPEPPAFVMDTIKKARIIVAPVVKLNSDPFIKLTPKQQLVASKTGVIVKMCEYCFETLTSEDGSDSIYCKKCISIISPEKCWIEEQPQQDKSDASLSCSNKALNGESEPVIEDTVAARKGDDAIIEVKPKLIERGLMYRYEIPYHSRVVSVPQPEELPLEFLTNLAKDNVNIYQYGSQNPTGNKRILLFGTHMPSCPECREVFPSLRILRFHYKKLHGRKLQSSTSGPDNDYVFRIKRNFNPHESKIMPCPVCKVNVYSSKLMQQHLLAFHRDARPFKCARCGKLFKTARCYVIHVKKFENSPNCNYKKCYICSQMINGEVYSKHVKTHKSLVCEQCGEKFPTAHRLNFHIALKGRINGVEDQYLCPSCGKLFGSPQSLNYHLRRYTCHKPKRKIGRKNEYLCPNCGKMFSTGKNLKNHRKVHETNRVKYKCVKCQKVFITRNGLARHVYNAHVTERVYECTICKKRCRTAETLKFHYSLKHNNKYSHLCNLCGEGFIREDYYRRHMNRHAFLKKSTV